MPDLDTWNTSVTDIADGRIAYRGVPIEELIDHGDAMATLWLVLFGSQATPGQADAMRRALIAALDHGVTAPSTLSARVVASTRGPVPLSIASGLIAFAGPSHGGAAEEAAKLFVQMAAEPANSIEGRVLAVLVPLLERKVRMPGYGHPYHSVDPRAEPLLSGGTAETGFREMARVCERLLGERTGKRLPMNGDAAVAALLLDAGLRPEDVTLVTAIGRAVGLGAHAREEQTREAPFRAPGLHTVTYEPEEVRS